MLPDVYQVVESLLSAAAKQDTAALSHAMEATIILMRGQICSVVDIFDHKAEYRKNLDAKF